MMGQRWPESSRQLLSPPTIGSRAVAVGTFLRLGRRTAGPPSNRRNQAEYIRGEVEPQVQSRDQQNQTTAKTMIDITIVSKRATR